METLSFADARAFDAWLARHHATHDGVWLKLAKKGGGVASVSYAEAIEVALVWGWIDGQKRALDERFWLQKFTRRGARSLWSKINRDKATALIAAGKMKPAGLAEVERARRDGRWERAYDGARSSSVPPDLTAALARTRRARAFFEALVADNIHVGRPEQIAIVFARQVRKTTTSVFRTRVFSAGTDVKIDFTYKHSRIKQYLKDGRALRIETVLNDPCDLGCLRRLPHLPELQGKARAVNRRLLDTERVGQGCVLASPAFERIAHPTVTAEGRRAPALRFGDPRVQALAGALAIAGALEHAALGVDPLHGRDTVKLT